MRILSDDKRITLLFLNWRDIRSAKAGGAEIFTHNMLCRLPTDRFRIIHFSPKAKELPAEETIDGIVYRRRGNLITVITAARAFYKRNRKRIDYVIDQCNTHRFFTPLWVRAKKRIFFIHQLTREIWQTNAPAPLGFIGQWSETCFLRLSRRDYTLTVSHSTCNALVSLGFQKHKIFILPEGLDFDAWPQERFLPKEEAPTFIYVGRYSDYKGIDKALQAFGRFKQKREDARFWIVGKKDEHYSRKVLEPLFGIYKLKEGRDVMQFGFVSQEKKLELMSRAHIMLFPSQREGWGLTISEAAVVGTPSIVFDSPGLRDAVDFGRAGYLCRRNSVAELTHWMERVIIKREEYARMRQDAYDFACRLTWDATANAFLDSFDLIRTGRAAPPELPQPAPLTALLVTSYNNEDTIKKILRSCLTQNYPSLLIILVDDGSTDRTVELARSLNDPRLRCIPIAHGERGAARQRAFAEAEKANPDYIFFFDSDMELQPDLVSLCVTDLSADQHTDALIIPEIPWSNSDNFFTRVKLFERSIINNAGERIGRNSIEAARFWRYSSYCSSGGLNFSQIAFEEIQPTLRCLDRGGSIRRATYTAVRHNEGQVTLRGLLSKKRYYFSQMRRTIDTEQGGLRKALQRWYFFRPVLYRPANLLRAISHPLLTTGMGIMYVMLSLTALNNLLKARKKDDVKLKSEEDRAA